MATSSTTLTAKGMSKVPVLPPIEGTQLRDEVRQIADAKEEIAKTTRVQNKLLRQRRSAVQRQQIQTLLYVFSWELLSVYHWLFPAIWQFCWQFVDRIITGCPEQWRLTDGAKRGGSCPANHQSHSFHLQYDNPLCAYGYFTFLFIKF